MLLEEMTKFCKSILLFRPRLEETPAEVIESPPDKDKVTARIESESVRIGSDVNLTSLISLSDTVFRSRSLGFHWDLESIIENTSANLVTGTIHDDTDDLPTKWNTSSTSSSRQYEIDSFVGVLGENGGLSVEFWIGQITDVIKHKEGGVRGLRVRWYEFHGQGGIYEARYQPCMLINQSTKRKDVLWVNAISADSVIVTLNSLTPHRRIPIIVACHIRDRLAELNSKNNRSI